MKIYPVLDLMRGEVVRGVAGLRDAYRPVRSCLTPSAEPLPVCRAFRDRLGLHELYLADLDAILHDQPHEELYSRLAQDGFALMIDAGLRDADSALRVLESGAAAVIAGLETWGEPEALGELVSRAGSNRVLFSLDLQGGAPLGDLDGWGTREPASIARLAIEAGVRRLIVLDLQHVGGGEGIGTLGLCRQLKDAFPHVELITGGGIRDGSDLQTAVAADMDGVLVASALHDGRIGRDELALIG